MTPEKQRAHDEARARARELAAEFDAKGDTLGWFDALYRESQGDIDLVPWADLEPNRFFKGWADKNQLSARGRDALVVGCGLGDDARFLHDLGFNVTAFDISAAAIDWAKKLHEDTSIEFVAADLFDPPEAWLQAFDFVLEIYTIQPLPLEMRSRVIDSIASFVKPSGELLVVCRGREDDERPDQLPWPLSRRELSRFGENGLEQGEFEEIWDEEDEQKRFIIRYRRPAANAAGSDS
ncbi:MAG: class I SAM-dependent methyltransferase [Acidobacteria bacterium]|nr:class I SAM-dependent methyltransferase [Acidobacteriota bacterium]